MKGNTSKKKMIVALSIAAVVVVAAIVSVVAVFAAPQQNVTSSVTVTYSVNDVVADASARYGFLAVARTEGAPTTYSAPNIKGAVGNAVSFSAEEGPQDKALNTAGLETAYPSSTESAVVFEFKFENKAAKAFTVALNDDHQVKGTPEQNNITMKYATSTGTAAAWDTLTWEDAYTTETVAALSDDTTEDVLYVYVMAVVTNLSAAAEFKANFNWTLAAA